MKCGQLHSVLHAATIKICQISKYHPEIPILSNVPTNLVYFQHRVKRAAAASLCVKFDRLVNCVVLWHVDRLVLIFCCE